MHHDSAVEGKCYDHLAITVPWNQGLMVGVNWSVMSLVALQEPKQYFYNNLERNLSN